MKTNTYRKTLLATGLLTLALCLSPLGVSGSDLASGPADWGQEPETRQVPPAADTLPQAKNKTDALVGSFIGTGTRSDGSKYVFLEAFHADGTCTTNSTLDFEPPLATPSYGAWKKTGTGTYVVTVTGALVNSPADFSFFGTYKLTITLKLDEKTDALNQDIKVEVFDATGKALFSDAATGTAKRIVAGS
ncbi:MAG: hypothetical protein K1Y36_16630 [Blastocatellia bacterium]|nr:hypothetical protein [Blastocatellia bacterium]